MGALLRAGLGLGLSLAAAGATAQDGVALLSVAGYGNFHAGGVTATVSGDANGNAVAALQWRVAGGTFAAAHPLVRIDPTHLSGSLFGLSPGTAYEARVTISDPNGVSGPASLVASFQTRPDTLPEPTQRTLYVSTTGNDGNPGTSPGAPLRTVQRAANLSQPGDLVLIQPGVYRESVTVTRSGTASQPIVFRGAGAGVILDGADAAIAAGVTWTPSGAGVYSFAPGFSTGHVVTEAGRLYAYTGLAELQALGAGAPGGFAVAGTTLHVKLADGSSPSVHAMHVARLENGFVLDGVAHVRVESLEIRHYGGAYGKGVYLRYASDCVVRLCRIHEVEAAGVWVKGGDRHRIEDNEIWDTSIFGWPWGYTKGSTAENNGVVFTDDVGRGNVVRRNFVHGTFNGVTPCGTAAPPAGVTNEIDLYGNVLYQHTDDGFEAEGYCANVRLWGNRMSAVHMAVAVAPAAPGPVWIVRNVAWRFGATRTSQVDGYLASALKINSGYPTAVGPLLLYHNTLLTDAPGTDAIALLNPGSATYVRAVNNVIAATRYALYKVNPVTWSGNGDDVYTTDPTRLVYWEGVRHDTLADYRAARGQELQGLSAPPLLVSPSGGDFTPSPGSPLVDAALAIPGLNDSYSGAGPDVGAIEWTGPPPSRSFHTVTPCRLADTRNPAGPSGGPALAANATRFFPVTGLCNVPAAAAAAALNVTVVNETGVGNLRLYAAGGASPVSSTVNFVPGLVRANNAVIPIGSGGRIAVQCSMPPGSKGQTDVVLDVTGYFE